MSISPTYDVVSPTGRRIIAGIRPAEPLSCIAGKKIGLVWGSFANGDVLIDALIGLFEKRFGTSRLVKLPSGKGLSWGDSPDSTLGPTAKEAGVDAVIIAVGC